MRGRVLGYNPEKQTGVISGDDGNRYYFERAEWESPNEPTANASVDFEVKDEKNAVAIYKISGAMTVALGGDSGEKSKWIAVVLAFCFGGLGAHKFYLGYQKQGIIMVLTFVLGIILLGLPSGIIALIAFVECIIYLSKSDEEFQKTYVENHKYWF